MPTFTVRIAGTKFRPLEAREVARNLTPHEVVILEPDPTNQYDSNAIQIWARDQFIGFVQKDMAAVLASKLHDGAEAYVSENIDPTGLHFIEIVV